MQQWTGQVPEPLTPSEGQATWMPILWSWSEVSGAANYHVEARTTTITGDSVSLLTAFALTCTICHFLPEWLQSSEAWATLKPRPRALYVELKRRYNGVNNSGVHLSQ